MKIAAFILLAFLFLPLPCHAGEIMRVLLKDDQQQLEVKIGGEVTCNDGQGGVLEGCLDGVTLRLETIADTLHVGGMPVTQLPLKITPVGGEVGINGMSLQSHVEFRKKPNGLIQAITVLDMQDYLKGVVPAEASPKWDLEVLKAQAVAARTFALYRKKSRAAEDFDVTADVNSQVWKNGGGSAVSDRAVDETDNLVMTYDGKLINAMFHACCGGETEDMEAVFGKPVDYLKPAEGKCPAGNPKMQWERWFSPEEIQEMLEKKGYSLGRIKDIRVAAQSGTRRAAKILVIHSKGHLVLKGNDFRKAMGWEVVPSTLFTLKKVRDRYNFEGRGSGHGVGLCQWGAREMSLQGKTFEEILHHYYKDVKIEPYKPDM